MAKIFKAPYLGETEAEFLVTYSEDLTRVRSSQYNSVFNKSTGFFMRWGDTLKKDPLYAPSPEILDIEITTKCKQGCAFCYKSNNPDGVNMSLETYKQILQSFNKDVLQQVAFGADSDLTSNPELWDMMQYTRDSGVVPNITVADARDPHTADKLAQYCGAVAVSRYQNKDVCYDSVKLLTDRGMSQVNIHMMLSQETLGQALETIEDMKTDLRLAKMQAIVFLNLKQKGRGIGFHTLPQGDFERLIARADELKISYGFDSCGAPKYLEYLEKRDLPIEEKERLRQSVEPCESGLFSSYISAEGIFYPCSFCEEVEIGIPLAGVKDFTREVWNHPTLLKWRGELLRRRASGCYECSRFKV